MTNLLPGFNIRIELLGNNYMSDIAKGGRGQKQPYTTTHFRIPEPLKPLVSAIAEQYRKRVQTADDVYDETLIRRSAQAVVGTGGEVNENLRTEVELLRAKVDLLQKRSIDTYEMLGEIAKMHSSHGSAIKKKVSKARMLLASRLED